MNFDTAVLAHQLNEFLSIDYQFDDLILNQIRITVVFIIETHRSAKSSSIEFITRTFDRRS